MAVEFKYPIVWPSDWPKTPEKMRAFNSGFKRNLTIDEAITLIDMESEDFKEARAFFVYTDVDNIRSSRNRRATGYDPSVVVKFSYQNQQYILACDRWFEIQQNIYAIYVALQTFRNFDRLGVANTKLLMEGFRADSKSNLAAEMQKVAAKSKIEDWQATLGLGPTATLEDAHAIYRRRAKAAGNDEKEILKLNQAMAIAKAVLR